MIEAARRKARASIATPTPMPPGANPLKNLLPQWVQIGGLEAMLARLALPETRERIRAEIERDGLNNWGRIPSWECVQISISPHLPQHAGETIAELAAARGARPDRCRLRLSDRGQGRDTRADHLDRRGGYPRDRALAHALWSAPTAIASPITGSSSQGMPHPRFYGTFPRIIGHYVHERAAAAARSRRCTR